MRFSRTLTVVDAHAEGESGKVVTGGIGQVPGHTMFDKREYFQTHLDQLRRLLLMEPRGAVWHHANAVIPSIAGRSWITSLNQLVIDPSDPFQQGFVVGSPWDPEV